MRTNLRGRLPAIGALLIIFGCAFLNVVMAADISVPGPSSGRLEGAARELNQLSRQSPIQEPNQFFSLLAEITKWLYTIFFIAAVILILFAAYNFLFARGDPEKIKNARNQILWAAVAVAVALLSVGATQIINSFIGGGAPSIVPKPLLPGQGMAP